MITKLSISKDAFEQLISYAKKHIIVRGNEETIYARNNDIDPKMSADDWLLDFRRMFLSGE